MKSTFMHSNVYLQYFLLSDVLTIQTLKRLKRWKHFKLHHVLPVSSKKMSSFLKRCKAALEDSIETLNNASLYSLKYGEELQSLVLKMDMLLFGKLQAAPGHGLFQYNEITCDRTLAIFCSRYVSIKITQPRNTTYTRAYPDWL